MKVPQTRWVKFKKSLCQSCFATCCHDMPLEVSIPDLIRLGLTNENETASDLARLAERLKKQNLIQSFHPRKMVFVIAQKKNKDCVFLDSKSRRCTVYENRPQICREFPRIGPRPGFCPYITQTK